MIGRFLASTAVAVMLTGTAMAQMTPPPSNDQGANPPPARIQTQNPAPRNQAQAPATDQMNRGDQMNQNNMSQPSMGDRAATGAKRTGQKAKSAMSGRGSANKQTAEGHAKDNIADKLNACEMKSASERQSCIDEATRM